MTDKKTRFANDLRLPTAHESEIPPNAKACANCNYARVESNPTVMRKVAVCIALPRFPVAFTTVQGTAVKFVFPVMDLHEVCGLFQSKTAPERDENGGRCE